MNSKPHLPPFLISKWGDTSYLQVTMGVFVRARRRHRAALLPWQQASTQEGPRGGWSSLVGWRYPRERRGADTEGGSCRVGHEGSDVSENLGLGG